jgi:hypothetical protein
MLIDVVRRGQGVLNIVPLAHVMEELDADGREHVAEQRTASRPRAASDLHTASGG